MDNAAIPHDQLAQELTGHMEFMRRMARALVRDEQIAEDVVQETMLAAIAHRPNPEAGLRVWLRSVLHRRVLLHFRTEQRRSTREALLLREEGPDAKTTQGDEERSLASIERTSMLGAAVAGLKDPYRAVIVLRFYDEHQPREIAKRLNRSVHTVNTQLQRGLQKLREQLDDANENDRRTWICALLPHALRGRRGWWPSSMKSFAGVSHGAFALGVAFVLVAVAGLIGLQLGTARNEDAVRERAIAQVEADLAQARAANDTLAPGLTNQLQAPVGTRKEALIVNVEKSPSGDPGVLQLQVRSSLGVLAGAQVVAVQQPHELPATGPIKTTLAGPDGLKMQVVSGGMRGLLKAIDRTGLETIECMADAKGMIALPILDGTSWRVEVESDGYAPKALAIRSLEPTMERSMELARAARIIVERGAFPLECYMYFNLRRDFGAEDRSKCLVADQQETEIHNLAPGNYELIAISSGGTAVARWFMPIQVTSDGVTRVDLSLDGGPTQLEIRGADPSAPPQFAHAHGPYLQPGTPAWHQFAPVNNGLVNFPCLPAGPAVVKILSRDSEVGRATFESRGGDVSHKVKVDLEQGKLRVLHRRVHGEDLSWRIAMRSDALGSENGWLPLGQPLKAKGDSWFHGLAPGEYRLWVNHSGSVRQWNLSLEGGTLVVDASVGQATTSPVGHIRIDRGTGTAAGAAVELEYEPGHWSAVTLKDDELELSHGTHRLRMEADGLGVIVREIEIPRDQSLIFSEDAPPRPIRVTCGTDGSGVEVRVTSTHSSTAAVKRSEQLVLDANGVGSIKLRPGNYMAIDRLGRVGVLVVRAGQTAAALVLQ